MANPIDVAHYQGELALQHLAVVKWAMRGPTRQNHLRYAEEHLAKCAAALGFDLVPRKTPAEAHEAAIAARRAEDDGGEVHARSMGIDDLEWSR